MPEVNFRVRWPDASATVCYSPSSTIKDVFVLGKPYAVGEFVAISRNALENASDRVAKKYGYGCAHAQRQIEEIEIRAAEFTDDNAARVVVEAFED
ncbi:MAG: hypothetical protein JWM78_2267 [Verrucomicrobiaceae bacterium]|nr:hypothetical protein [Verrucomicrobiaceae bacterium]